MIIRFRLHGGGIYIQLPCSLPSPIGGAEYTRRLFNLLIVLVMILAISITPVYAQNKSIPIQKSTIVLDIDAKDLIISGDEIETQGPESFFIDKDGYIFLADTINSRIMVFKDNKLTEEIKLSDDIYIKDIFVYNKQIYLLNADESILVISKDEKKQKLIKIPIHENNISVSKMNDESCSLRYAPKFIYVDYEGIVLGYQNNRVYSLKSNSLCTIEPEYTFSLSDTEYSITNLSNKSSLTFSASKLPVEVTTLYNCKNSTFLVAEADFGENGLLLDRKVVMIDQKFKTINYNLADYDYYVPNKTVFVDSKENVYQLVASPKRITIYKLAPNSKKPYISKYETKGSSHNESYSLNNNTKSYSGISKSNCNIRLLRGANLSWTYSKSDNGNKNVISSSNRGNVSQPRYLRNISSSATVRGIPYCWGGMDSEYTRSSSSWTDFLNAINKNKYAGNIHTSGHHYIPNTCGTDCSGFVTSSFNLGRKHSTRGLIGSGKPFKQVNRDPGNKDIFNKSGSHVVVTIEKRIENGSWIYVCFESTTRSRKDRVMHWYRRVSSFSNGYVTGKYRHWI